MLETDTSDSRARKSSFELEGIHSSYTGFISKRAKGPRFDSLGWSRLKMDETPDIRPPTLPRAEGPRSACSMNET